jgi:hypothetical protein
VSLEAARDKMLAIVEVAKVRLRSPIDAPIAHDLAAIVTLARTAIAELVPSMPPAPIDVAAQLEAASRSDADEVLRRLTPSRFDQAAAAAKRVPSGTMAAVRDTDPAPPPTRPSDR